MIPLAAIERVTGKIGRLDVHAGFGEGLHGSGDAWIASSLRSSR